MFLVAVTGGIGAGKTSALAQFEARGCRTLDADAVVHEMYEPGSPMHGAMVGRWGDRVLDEYGGIDRATVAEMVFEKPAEREWLNGQVHPLVQNRIVAEAAKCFTPLFCGIPLLYEVGWEHRMHAVIAVWCDRRTQHRRLLARGWSEHEIERRVACQMDMDEKLERADIGIINVGSLKLLETQCERAIGMVMQRANSSKGRGRAQ